MGNTLTVFGMWRRFLEIYKVCRPVTHSLLMFIEHNAPLVPDDLIGRFILRCDLCQKGFDLSSVYAVALATNLHLLCPMCESDLFLPDHSPAILKLLDQEQLAQPKTHELVSRVFFQEFTPEE